MVTRETLTPALERLGLTRHARAIEAAVRPTLHIVRTRNSDADIPLGASKIGGAPDLNESTPWPVRTIPESRSFFRRVPAYDQPLDFIAQFDLASLQHYEVGALLPPTGLLSFFFEPYEFNVGRVLYQPASSGLTRRPAPSDPRKDKPRLLQPSSLTFTEYLSVRDQQWMQRAEDLAEWDERPEFAADRCDDAGLIELFGLPFGEPFHQLFGYAFEIQDGSKELGFVLEANGVSPKSAQEWADAERTYGEAANEWLLLLQIDGEEARWGDGGILSCWIKRESLARRRFDEVQFVLDMY